MTKKQALQVVVGMQVVHPASATPYEPLRVRAVATSHAGRAMAKIEGCGSGWLPLTEYGLPPRGWAWHGLEERGWVKGNGKAATAAELRALMPQLDLLEAPTP